MVPVINALPHSSKSPLPCLLRGTEGTNICFPLAVRKKLSFVSEGPAEIRREKSVLVPVSLLSGLPKHEQLLTQLLQQVLLPKHVPPRHTVPPASSVGSAWGAPSVQLLQHRRRLCQGTVSPAASPVSSAWRSQWPTALTTTSFPRHTSQVVCGQSASGDISPVNTR